MPVADQLASLPDDVVAVEEWQIDTMKHLAHVAFETEQVADLAFETEQRSQDRRTIGVRDQCATPMLLNEWREITDGWILAGVWQDAAERVVQSDSTFPERDKAAMQKLAEETKAEARAWLEDVARKWLGDAGAAWVAGNKPWADVRDVPDGVDGVPAVSQALAEFIRQLEPETANDWIEAEKDRTKEQLAQLPLWSEDQPFALPGWFVSEGSKVVNDGNTVGLWRVMTARHKATPAATTLAWAVWDGRLRQQLLDQRERKARTHSPALPFSFARATIHLSRRVSVRDSGIVESKTADTGLRVAGPAVDLDALRAMTDSLHTLHARRTVYWCSRTAWAAYIDSAQGEARGDDWRARSQPDGSVFVEVVGGKQRLAELVGSVGSAAQAIPYETLRALSELHLAVETDVRELRGALVSSVSAERGNQIRPGRVSFTLSPWWGVGAVQRLPHGQRVLVPVLDVPPMDSIAEVHQPAVAALEQAALAELAQRSMELVRVGAVAVDWHELGNGCGLSAKVVDNALKEWRDLDRWRQRGTGWQLGEHEDVQGARTLLIEGGNLRLSASRRGQASARRKKKKSYNQNK